MKIVVYLFVILFSLGLVSCQLGQGNFNKQKYTKLRHIKPSTERINKINEDSKGGEVANNTVENSDEVNPEIINEETDPKKAFIKKAVEEKTPIYVIVKGKNYLIRNPVYDQFYNAIVGVMEEKKMEEVQGEYVHLEAVTYSYRLGRQTVYLDDIKTYRKTSASSGEIKKEETSPQEHEIETKEEEGLNNDGTLALEELRRRRKNQKSYQLASLTDYKHSKHSQKAKRHLLSGIATLVIGVVLSTVLVFFSWTAMLVIAAITYILSLALFTSAALNIKRYKNQMLSRRKRVGTRYRAISAFSWFFIVVISLFALFIPLIVAIAVFFKGQYRY